MLTASRPGMALAKRTLIASMVEALNERNKVMNVNFRSLGSSFTTENLQEGDGAAAPARADLFEPQQDGLWREHGVSANAGDGVQYAPKGGNYPKLPDEPYEGTTVRPGRGKPVRVECEPGTHPETTTTGSSSTTTCQPNDKKEPEKTKPVAKPGDAPILD
jgi:hypothetical protein